MIRSSPLIEYSSTILLICLWLGAITTVFSSLIGLFQQDIKKVIAYSTMSQLAREYTSHSSIFRHQTVCEHIVFTIKILIYFSIFFWNISFRHFLRKESTINKFGRASNFFLLLFIIIKKTSKLGVGGKKNNREGFARLFFYPSNALLATD